MHINFPQITLTTTFWVGPNHHDFIHEAISLERTKDLPEVTLLVNY